MVYIAYFTELNLRICDYAQKRRICRKNCNYAFDENFHGHFCPPRKAAKFCHPVLRLQISSKCVLLLMQKYMLTQSARWPCSSKRAYWSVLKHVVGVKQQPQGYWEYYEIIKNVYWECIICIIVRKIIDNCKDFSDYNDIIAPLDKLIIVHSILKHVVGVRHCKQAWGCSE